MTNTTQNRVESHSNMKKLDLLIQYSDTALAALTQTEIKFIVFYPLANTVEQIFQLLIYLQTVLDLS